MPFHPALLDRLERTVRRYGAGTPTDRAELASAISPLGVGLDPDYAEFVERFGVAMSASQCTGCGTRTCWST